MESGAKSYLIIDNFLIGKVIAALIAQHTVSDNSDHCFPSQNGIWVKFYHFWAKNDGEKWSRIFLF